MLIQDAFAQRQVNNFITTGNTSYFQVALFDYIDINNAELDELDYDETSNVYGFAYGSQKQFTSGLSYRTEFAYSSLEAETDNSDHSIDMHLLHFNGYLQYRLAQLFQPYIGVGYGGGIVDDSGDISFLDSDFMHSMNIMVGSSFEVTEMLNFAVEYRRNYLSEDGKFFDDEKTNYTNDAFVISARLHF
jgi:opacity protein-like surface antigen